LREDGGYGGAGLDGAVHGVSRIVGLLMV